MSWFKKLMPSRIRTEAGQRSRVRSNVPEGLWTKCTACNAVLYRPELERNLEVCPKCNHHLRIYMMKIMFICPFFIKESSLTTSVKMLL